jgi:hypothetical protein
MALVTTPCNIQCPQQLGTAPCGQTVKVTSPSTGQYTFGAPDAGPTCGHTGSFDSRFANSDLCVVVS